MDQPEAVPSPDPVARFVSRSWRQASRWVAARWKVLRRRFVKPHPVDFRELHRLCLFAEAVYEPAETIKRLCGDDFDAVEVRENDGMRIQYFIATDRIQRTHLIAIQGTAGIRHTLFNFAFSTAMNKDLGVHLHRGFADAARQIYTDAAPRLDRGFGIRLTGHSLGGALAALLGMYFQSGGWRVDEIVTFGQPKITDTEGQKKFRDLPLLRVVDELDIFPLLPPYRLFFFFGRQYRHVGRELILLDGPHYCFLEERSAERKWSYSFLGRLEYRGLLNGEVKGHSIVHYLRRIEDKVAGAVEVPYRRRDQYQEPDVRAVEREEEKPVAADEWKESR